MREPEERKRSFAFALRLVDDADAMASYRKAHQEVWPEVTRRMRRAGITEMKIFLIGREMFMYCEAVPGFDPARDMPRLQDDPTYRRWDELMATMQERVPDAKPGEWWAAMEEVFDLNWPQHREPPETS